MKTRLLIALIVVSLPLMAMLSPSAAVPPLAQGARPTTPLALEQLKIGERSRPLQSDGGGLLLWTADAGVATATVSAGGLYVIENAGTVAQGCWLCGPNPDGVTWDGGCSTTSNDPNYGRFLDGGSSVVVLLRDTTTTLKAIPASGVVTCTLPVWLMR